MVTQEYEGYTTAGFCGIFSTGIAPGVTCVMLDSSISFHPWEKYHISFAAFHVSSTWFWDHPMARGNLGNQY
jgi:hypothetical protein